MILDKLTGGVGGRGVGFGGWNWSNERTSTMVQIPLMKCRQVVVLVVDLVALLLCAALLVYYSRGAAATLIAE